MANNTSLNTRNLVIYEIYVRNYGPHGTFLDVEEDLERIQSLGVDFIWLMPIQPIGKLNRKGSLGCPYSIVDYRKVNPEYGTIDDFKHLIEKAHANGLKVMIDVVFNHTAHDSVLIQEHPDWFHQDKNGNPISTITEWTDVIDLKHPNPELTRYLIDSLIYWVEIGVDGFRCDVASFLPLEFWLQAREEVARIKTSVVWLAESIPPIFVGVRRRTNLIGMSDSELFRAFDICYDYDIFPVWQSVVQGKLPVSRYIELLRLQECIYPTNYAKLRFVENHDQDRIMQITQSKSSALAWTAFSAFIKGPWLIYAGQESGTTHRPSLFDVDKISWDNYDLSDLISRLAKIKKNPAMTDGNIYWLSDDNVVQATWLSNYQGLYGIFNTTGEKKVIKIQVPDGNYKNLISDESIIVEKGMMTAPNTATIFHYIANELPIEVESSLFPF